MRSDKHFSFYLSHQKRRISAFFDFIKLPAINPPPFFVLPENSLFMHYRILIPFLLSLFLITSLAAQEKAFFDWDHIPEIRMTFYDQNWHQQLDSLKISKSDERLLAALTYQGETYDSVGVRYKGNSSFFGASKAEERKLPFNIKLDEEKEHRLPGGFDKIKLSNVFRDPSFLREVLSYEVARKYMPAPRANYAKLYINDQFVGLYNSTESIEEPFFENHFQDDGEGITFKCDPIWGAEQPSRCPEGDKASLMYLGSIPNCYFPYYEKKSDHGWTKLVELTRILNKQPDSLEYYLNVELALWMLAFNNVMVNLDSYSGRLCHNYYLYRDSTGRFNPLVWDMNLCLGGFRFDGSGKPLSNDGLQTLSPFLHFRNPKRPLISVLLQNSHYRKAYVAHLRTITEDFFLNGKLMERALEVKKFIAPHVEADENKLYSYEAFEKNIEQTAEAGNSHIVGLSELIDTRAAYLSEHPLFQKQPPKPGEHKAEVQGDEVTFQLAVDGSATVYVYTRAGAPEAYVKHRMLDDGQSSDGAPGDGLFGLTLPYRKGMQYYFTAENDDALIYEPRFAGWYGFELE